MRLLVKKWVLSIIFILLCAFTFPDLVTFRQPVSPLKLYGNTLGKINMIDQQLQQFSHDIGTFPETLEYLYSNYNNKYQNWKRPYYKNEDYVLDNWRNRLVYHFPSRISTKAYDLYSMGRNGKDDNGGKDDITWYTNINDKYYRVYGVIPHFKGSIKIILIPHILFFAFFLAKFLNPKFISSTDLRLNYIAFINYFLWNFAKIFEFINGLIIITYIISIILVFTSLIVYKSTKITNRNRFNFIFWNIVWTTFTLFIIYNFSFPKFY